MPIFAEKSKELSRYEPISEFFDSANSLGEADCHCDDPVVMGEEAKPINPKDLHLGVSLDIGVPLGEKDGVSILSEEQAKKLFKAFEDVDYMLYKYMDDGCYIRAHEFALIAERFGIKMNKSFLLPEEGSLLFPDEAFKANEKAFMSGFQGWKYHVAASVYVQKEDGSVEPYVFDVGTQKKEMNYEQWKSSLNPKGQKSSVKTRPSQFIFDDSNLAMPGESVIDWLIERQEQIDELGEDEYMFRVEQGWL